MFAIALYDERKQSLLLARDGSARSHSIRAEKGRFYFGSEIKTILAVAPEAFFRHQFPTLPSIFLQYIPIEFGFSRYRQAAARALLEYKGGKVSIRQY